MSDTNTIALSDLEGGGLSAEWDGSPWTLTVHWVWIRPRAEGATEYRFLAWARGETLPWEFITDSLPSLIGRVVRVVGGGG